MPGRVPERAIDVWECLLRDISPTGNPIEYAAPPGTRPGPRRLQQLLQVVPPVGTRRTPRFTQREVIAVCRQISMQGSGNHAE